MSAILKKLIVSDIHLRKTDNYWKYLTPKFESHLDQYLPVFEKYREQINAVPTLADWKQLPFGKFANDGAWKWRRESLSLLQKITTGKKVENVLEIGCWNGWLTKSLAKQSETVVAIDYFTHALDGLGNIESLAPNIFAMQCNLEETSAIFKPQTFDLIVVNHCLSYTKNPVETLRKLVPLLRANGKIISLGNSFYRNPQKKIAENQNLTQLFHQQYHLDVFIQPVKGFIDKNDVALLKQSGFKIKRYAQKFLHNAYAKLNPFAPEYIAIIYAYEPK